MQLVLLADFGIIHDFGILLLRTKIFKYFINHLDFGINPDFGIDSLRTNWYSKIWVLLYSLNTNLVTRFEHHICMLSQFPTTRRRFGIRYTPIMLCVNTEDPNEEMNCTHTEYYCVIAQCVSDKIHTYMQQTELDTFFCIASLLWLNMISRQQTMVFY